MIQNRGQMATLSHMPCSTHPSSPSLSLLRSPVLIFYTSFPFFLRRLLESGLTSLNTIFSSSTIFLPTRSCSPSGLRGLREWRARISWIPHPQRGPGLLEAGSWHPGQLSQFSWTGTHVVPAAASTTALAPLHLHTHCCTSWPPEGKESMSCPVRLREGHAGTAPAGGPPGASGQLSLQALFLSAASG